MYRYLNRNTGDVVDRDTLDRRLERLANWERLDTFDAPTPDDPPTYDAPPDDPPPVVTDPTVPVPQRNASRAAWADYAASQGMDPDIAGSMKRDELAARYLTD